MQMVAAHRMESPISRLVDADARAALRVLEGSTLVEEGRVNLIGLDAIVRRLGPRWPGRCEQVHDHVAKALERRLGADGYFVRVSDDDYLLVHPTLGRFAAQAACLTFMRELLTHFLGEALPADLAVREVTTLSHAGLEARLVEPGAAKPGATGLDEPRSFAPVEAAQPSTAIDIEAVPMGNLDRWSPFVASNGRVVRVDCAIDPCFRLGETQQIGFRIDPCVIDSASNERLGPEALRRLSTAELEHVDMAALTSGLARLKRETRGCATPMLLAAASYPTIMSRRGRANLIATLREAAYSVAQRLICEVRNIEGVPSPMLFDAAAALRPYCYAVIGRLDAAPDRRVRGFSGAGLNGLSFEAHAADSPELFDEIVSGIAAARRVVRSVVVHGLPSHDHLTVAQMAGATHASLRAGAARIPKQKLS
jgi:hypothetical protein